MNPRRSLKKKRYFLGFGSIQEMGAREIDPDVSRNHDETGEHKARCFYCVCKKPETACCSDPWVKEEEDRNCKPKALNQLNNEAVKVRKKSMKIEKEFLVGNYCRLRWVLLLYSFIHHLLLFKKIV